MIRYIAALGLITSPLYTADAVVREYVLPFPYYKDKNKQIPYLAEGCCTLLTQKDQKILVGPHLHYPLIVLWTKYKTLVANKDEGASIQSLINIAGKAFGSQNLSYTKGLIYAHSCEYNNNNDNAHVSGISWKTLHQGRTQQEEFVFLEKELTHGLQLAADADNIKTRIFDAEYVHHTSPTAPLFVIVKHTDEGPKIFSVCPLAERLFAIPELDHPYFDTIEHKIELLREKLVQYQRNNPYYRSIEHHLAHKKVEELYGAFHFVQV